MQANMGETKNYLPAAPQAENKEKNGETEIDLLELLYHLVDKLPQILIAGLVCAVLVAGWVFMVETPTYQATAKLYVVNATNSLVNLQDLQLGNSLANDYMQVFSNVEVHDQVRQKLHLDYSDQQLDRMVSITNPSNTRILVITVNSKNQYEALKMAEAYAETAQLFIEDRMESSMPSLFEKPTARNVPQRRAQRVIIGFLLGALAMAAVHVALFIMDDRITSSEFIEKRTGITTLGMMPVLSETGTAVTDGRKTQPNNK